MARERFRGLLEEALEAVDYYAVEGSDLSEDRVWWQIREALRRYPRD